VPLAVPCRLHQPDRKIIVYAVAHYYTTLSLNYLLMYNLLHNLNSVSHYAAVKIKCTEYGHHITGERYHIVLLSSNSGLHGSQWMLITGCCLHNVTVMAVLQTCCTVHQMHVILPFHSYDYC